MKYATGSEAPRRGSVRLVYGIGNTGAWIVVTVKPGFQWVPPGVRGSRVMGILQKGGGCVMQGKEGNKGGESDN